MLTHLTKRANRYYIRRKIPVDLQAHYGRKEIVKSLGTSDPAKAAVLCRKEGVALDDEFAAARAKIAAAAGPADTSIASAPDNKPINADEVAGSTLALLRQRRDAAALRGHLALNEFMERQQVNLEDQEAMLRGEIEPLHALSKHEGHRNALRAFLTGDGSVVATAPASRPSAKGKTSFDELAGRWQRERKPQQRTMDKAMRAIRRFKELVGDLAVEQITKAHVIEFKDKFLASEQSPGVQQTPVNTDKYIEQLRILLSYASKNAIIEHNPAKDVSTGDRRDAKSARLPFDLPALKAIFSGPVYSEGARPVGGAGEAAYWLPLLGLFTGARLEELGQLRPEDVYEETYFDDHDVEQSAWVLRITGYGAGQEVKNDGSNRRFPVHPELIRLGFLKYVKQAAGRARLCAKLKPDPYGTETGNWSSWFGIYLRTKLNIRDERMVFHSFRHKFKDAARAVGIAEDVSDAITGHSSGNVARRYGGLTYPLRPLVEAMNRYRIPGLVLPAPAD